MKLKYCYFSLNVCRLLFQTPQAANPSTFKQHPRHTSFAVTERLQSRKCRRSDDEGRKKNRHWIGDID